MCEKSPQIKFLHLFLASSAELVHERILIGSLFSYVTRYLSDIKAPIRMFLEKWEYLDSSFGMKRKQEEYNSVLKKCDAAIVMFWKKTGMFTKEEFRVARESLHSGTNNHRVSVYFKKIEEEESKDVAAMKAEVSDLGIPVETFSSDSDLQGLIAAFVFRLLEEYGIPRPSRQQMAIYHLANGGPE